MSRDLLIFALFVAVWLLVVIVTMLAMHRRIERIHAALRSGERCPDETVGIHNSDRKSLHNGSTL